jgi:hypothetical protein
MSDLKEACDLVERTFKELVPEGGVLDFFRAFVVATCAQHPGEEPSDSQGAHRCRGSNLYEAMELLRKYKAQRAPGLQSDTPSA